MYIFQFKLSMTKTQLDWTCNLTPLLSMYFSSVFSSLDKTCQWFFHSFRVKTPHILECLAISLLAWLLLSKPSFSYALTNLLSLSGIQWFSEDAIYTHIFLPQFLFPFFSPGLSFKTCWLWQLYEVGIIYLFLRWRSWSLESLLCQELIKFLYWELEIGKQVSSE